MHPTPSTAPATYPDQPRLVRWAHGLTFLGLIVPGLSLGGIAVALQARKAGEFGADKALRNAIAVTAFLILVVSLYVAIASFL